MEGHAKKCAERYCELASKKIVQLYKVSTSCEDDHDHRFKNEELETGGEFSKVCSHIVSGPSILWSVHNLGKSDHQMK